MTRVFLLIATILIVAGRLSIPTRELTGWPGFVEAFAHLLLGAMIAVAVLRQDLRRLGAALVIGLSLFEVAMFTGVGAAHAAETAPAPVTPDQVNALFVAWNALQTAFWGLIAAAKAFYEAAGPFIGWISFILYGVVHLGANWKNFGAWLGPIGGFLAGNYKNAKNATE